MFLLMSLVFMGKFLFWLIKNSIDEAGGTLKFDKESSSIIRLNHAGGSEDKIVLYLREVDKCLALVCIINEREFHKQHLINYNIDRFKEGLRKIFLATKSAFKKWKIWTLNSIKILFKFEILK